jgi:hypothetical protein
MRLCCGSDRFVSLSLASSKPAALPKTIFSLLFNTLSLGIEVRDATKIFSLACFERKSVGSQRTSSSASKLELEIPLVCDLQERLQHGLHCFTYVELLCRLSLGIKMRTATNSRLSWSRFSKADLVHQLHATVVVCPSPDQQAISFHSKFLIPYLHQSSLNPSIRKLELPTTQLYKSPKTTSLAEVQDIGFLSCIFIWTRNAKCNTPEVSLTLPTKTYQTLLILDLPSLLIRESSYPHTRSLQEANLLSSLFSNPSLHHGPQTISRPRKIKSRTPSLTLSPQLKIAKCNRKYCQMLADSRPTSSHDLTTAHGPQQRRLSE